MKKIKLFSLVLVSVFSLFGLTGCGSENVEGSLEDLMTKMYQDIPEDQRPMLANIVIDEENIEMFLGTSEIEYEEALASEPMMGSIAHSVVLLRTKDNADIEAIKTKIKESVDPRKWICVGVEEDDVIVKNKGNLIILIMVEDEDTLETLEEAFDNL